MSRSYGIISRVCQKICQSFYSSLLVCRYGNSDGVPTERGMIDIVVFHVPVTQIDSGLRRDAQAALDFVLADSQLSSVPIVRIYLSL